MDALRGVAALAVVIFHAKRLLGQDVMPSGYLAVDFFFVLSGFVIAHAYDPRLRAGMSSTTFIWHRLARFYPLYFLGFAAGLLYEVGLIGMRNPAAIPVHSLLPAAAAGLLFLPFPFAQRDGNLFAFNIPSWSLFFELAVNAAYALFFRFLTVPVLTALVALNGAIFAAIVVTHGTADFGALDSQVVFAIPRTLFSFCTGLLIYRLEIKALTMPALVIFALIVAPMVFPVGPAVALAFVFAISPLVVVLGSSVEPGQRTRKLFEFLGAISFPIYALHRPALAFAQTASQRFHLSPLLMLALVIVALVALSPLIERFYDKPMRKKLDRLAKAVRLRGRTVEPEG
ncbi:acyltransferase family protein [Sphingomonas sp. M1A8_2b]